MKNKTLEYYDKNCDEYFQNTVFVDLSHLYFKFIEKLPKEAKVLDLGCGSGRDSLYFKNQGYNVTAIDGSKELADLASKLIKQDVIVSNFEELELSDKFNGIWACASLLHLNEIELEKLLTKLEKSLVKDGILYISFKYGTKEYVDDKGRYFNCYTEETIKRLIEGDLSLEIKELFKTNDATPGREDVVWLNIFCIKKG